MKLFTGRTEATGTRVLVSQNWQGLATYPAASLMKRKKPLLKRRSKRLWVSVIDLIVLLVLVSPVA
ncbi:hypothetical protein [Fibrivirga algicola]|uniref:RDD family protein n=1 Tax=Fibrivirga algicola TaxID=2950420 RepID=A0ABX0QEV3_9BACT|nr:hypothetical protein [Fibrivirga algicola]NID09512.1 hypothetical protein [Fibrivirga algicola]